MSKRKVSGTFSLNQKGFGFIDSDKESFFVSPKNTLFATTGDTVSGEVLRKGQGGKDDEAKITRVDKRSSDQIVGVFSEQKNGEDIGLLNSKDRNYSLYKVEVEGKGIHPKNDDVVIGTISHYPNKINPNFKVIITDIIGNSSAPGVDILEVLSANKIPTKFSEEALDELKNIPDVVSEKEIIDQKRNDFRDELIITIDADDTKDIDDAVTLKKLENGNYQLGVHIADVSNYVKIGTALDKSAYDRGTSVYLVDKVVPMIPQEISNGIASLNPNVDRLTLSIVMEIDKNGNVINSNITKGVIKSHTRISYKNVNAILSGDQEVSERFKTVVPMLKTAKELHEILSLKRNNRGAIEFDTPESKIIVDKNGTPIDIEVRERGVGERLIESFMLAANESIAEFFDKRNVQFLYRIHEKPDSDKINSLLEFLRAIGVPIKFNSKEITPKILQDVLDSVKGSSMEMMIRTMLLRTMQQAKYSPESLGHFGLATQYYTHFTSPIRRYPDLVVHRLVKHYLTDKHVDKELGYKLRNNLKKIGSDTSSKERRAIDAERTVDAMKKAEYMSSKIGQEFSGTISAVLKFGMFVSLDNTIEGLVHISSMTDDYYSYNESNQTLVGRGKHKEFKVGQKVKIKVSNSNKEDQSIDFVLV